MLGIPSSTDTLEAKLSTETQNIQPQVVIQPCPAPVFLYADGSMQTAVHDRLYKTSEHWKTLRTTNGTRVPSFPIHAANETSTQPQHISNRKIPAFHSVSDFTRRSATHMASSMAAGRTADAPHCPTTLHPSGRPVANDGISVQYNVLTKLAPARATS